MFASSCTDSRVPTWPSWSVDTLLAIRLMPRTEVSPAILTVPLVDRLEPRRAKDREETEDPMFAHS